LEEEIEEIENNAPENNKTDDKNNSENVDENIDNALIEDDIIDNAIIEDAIIYKNNDDKADENNIIKKCHLCNKLFDKNNSLLWVACQKCDNWYCGSCEKVHNMDDSYYCVACLTPSLQNKVFSPTKTSSPVLAKPRNDLIKIVRAKQKRARQDMLESNVKRKKIVEYEKDDKVSVRSMEPDKLVGDVRRVPAIIIGKTGTKDIFYELLTSYGVLEIKYRASDLELYY